MKSDLKAMMIDLVGRASEMEETMAGALIDLCAGKGPIEDLSLDVHRRVFATLEIIKADTLRHREILVKVRERIENG